MKSYRYTECGLDNVVIVGVDFLTADDGEEVIIIPAAGKLHKAIAESILRRPFSMSGRELRFLRTEMGMTQAELARLLHRDAQTIARWEKEEIEMDGNVETVVRLLAAEKLGIDLGSDIEAVAIWSTPSKAPREIRIEGSPEGDYRPVAA